MSLVIHWSFTIPLNRLLPLNFIGHFGIEIWHMYVAANLADLLCYNMLLGYPLSLLIGVWVITTLIYGWMRLMTSRVLWTNWRVPAAREKLQLLMFWKMQDTPSQLMNISPCLNLSATCFTTFEVRFYIPPEYVFRLWLKMKTDGKSRKNIWYFLIFINSFKAFPLIYTQPGKILFFQFLLFFICGIFFYISRTKFTPDRDYKTLEISNGIFQDSLGVNALAWTILYIFSVSLSRYRIAWSI